MATTKTKPAPKTATKNAATKAPAAKAAPVKKVAASANLKGVTEMTKEKHSYEGYSVRAQKDGHTFRQYVSASDRVRTTEKTPEARKKTALAEANALRTSLGDIIDNPKSWSGVGVLKQAAAKAIKALGFKHEGPKA